MHAHACLCISGQPFTVSFSSRVSFLPCTVQGPISRHSSRQAISPLFMAVNHHAHPPSAPVSPAPASPPPSPLPSAHQPSTPPSSSLEPPAHACDADDLAPAEFPIAVSPPAPDPPIQLPVPPSRSAPLSSPELPAPVTPTPASPSSAPQPSPNTSLPLSAAPARDADTIAAAVAASIAASLAVSHPGDARDADHLAAAVAASIAHEASARAAENAAYARALVLSRAGEGDEELRRATASSIDAAKRGGVDEDLRRAVEASIEEARRAERAAVAARIEEDVFGGVGAEDGECLGEKEMLERALANSVREKKISVEEMQEVAIRECNLEYVRRLRMQEEEAAVETGERGVGDVNGPKREEGAHPEGETGTIAEGAGHGDVMTVDEVTVAAYVSVKTAVGGAVPHAPAVVEESAASLVCVEAAEELHAIVVPTLAGKRVSVATGEETDARESDAAAADHPEILRALALSATEKTLSMQEQQAVLLEECRRVDVRKLSRERSDSLTIAPDSLLSSATAVEPDLAKALEASSLRGTLTIQEQQTALLAEYFKTDEMLPGPSFAASEAAIAAYSRLDSVPSAVVSLPSAAGSGQSSQVMMDTDPALRQRSAKHLSIKPGESVDGNWLRGRRPNRRVGHVISTC